jgi:hypothetical protein
LEEIVPEGAAESAADNSQEKPEESSEHSEDEKKSAQAVVAKEKPADVEIMATWPGKNPVRTKGHPAREGWWLVYHPGDDDWYYMPEVDIKLLPKHKKLKDLFKRHADK